MDDSVPNYIYKYMKLETFIIMIKAKALWFSSPEDFNDPFDCNLFLSPSIGDNGQEIYFRLPEEHRNLPLGILLKLMDRIVQKEDAIKKCKEISIPMASVASRKIQITYYYGGITQIATKEYV